MTDSRNTVPRFRDRKRWFFSGAFFLLHFSQQEDDITYYSSTTIKRKMVCMQYFNVLIRALYPLAEKKNGRSKF